jgi:hypothetical protein
VFDLPRVRAGIALAGVVIVDDGRAGDLVRRQLHANDVAAPLLHPSPATRRTLDSLTRGVSPALVVIDPGLPVRILRAPQSPSQLLALTDTLGAIAARVAARPSPR